MAHPSPLTAQLVADLFLAIDQDDPAATFAAARALADRIGEPAALALARGLIADHRWPGGFDPVLVTGEGILRTVRCA